LRLNVGCGPDKWGDVRLDVAYRYRDRKITPNFIADAQNLPFQDLTFSEVKASNIIEEIPSWKKGLEEWTRVCKDKLIIVFPIGDGFKRPVIQGLCQFRFSVIKDAVKCRKQRCHYWIINPKIISNFLQEKGFQVTVRVKSPILFRPRRLLPKLLKERARLKVLYEVIAKRSL